MKKSVKRWIEKGMMQYMEQTIREMAQEDLVYQNDKKDEQELEERYEELALSREQRMFMNDYLACIKTVAHRYAEISYMAGIQDALEMLVLPGSHLDNRLKKGGKVAADRK